MRVVRSWPVRRPAGRACVDDDLDRVIIDNHHYGPLAAINEDVLLLEWDIAVGKHELAQFAAAAHEDPHQVLVAPYRIYSDNYGISEDIWAHRHWDGTGSGTVVPVGATPIATGDPDTNLFGLGMVYLPRVLIRGFVTDRYSAHFGDVEFSMWHYQRVATTVPVYWPVIPVHLNYQIREAWKEPAHGGAAVPVR